MYDILKICQNKLLIEELMKNNKENGLTLKKAHVHIGAIFEREKKFFIAIEFYKAGGAFSKVIEAYRKWFSKILDENELSPDSIRDVCQGIKKLAALGLVQEAIEWCYKFYDSTNDPIFISHLESFSLMNKGKNKESIEIIEDMKNGPIFII